MCSIAEILGVSMHYRFNFVLGKHTVSDSAAGLELNVNGCYIVTEVIHYGEESNCRLCLVGSHGAAEIGEPGRGSSTSMARSALQDGVSATTEAGVFDYATASEDY
jgi:hypothetical protein